MISLIAAIGKNNELGKGNTLVWHMPTDMKFFRETTSGHTVIMGRKTFESIGRPMPNRQNIIITRDKDYKAEGIEVVNSLEEALEKSRTSPQPSPTPPDLPLSGEANRPPDKGEHKGVQGEGEEIFIIGGAEIYKQSMQVADRLYITHIEAEDKNADTFFPEIIPIVWNEISHEEHEPDENNKFKYTFSVYERF